MLFTYKPKMCKVSWGSEIESPVIWKLLNPQHPSTFPRTSNPRKRLYLTVKSKPIEDFTNCYIAAEMKIPPYSYKLTSFIGPFLFI